MPEKNEIRDLRERTHSYLVNSLLPFWIHRSPDPEYGGFLSYFDRDGRATGETVKPFLMQIRMLFAMSAAHRAGYGDGRCAELARRAADFIIEHYWDPEHEGWYWIADRDGTSDIQGQGRLRSLLRDLRIQRILPRHGRSARP